MIKPFTEFQLLGMTLFSVITETIFQNHWNCGVFNSYKI